MIGFPKPNRTERLLGIAESRHAKVLTERKNKRLVKDRDRGCRFPLCGCRKQHLPLVIRGEQVSHEKHKSVGGDSSTANMAQMCAHRHQFGKWSRHKGTLRAVFLTRRGFDGPVAWELRDPEGERWFEFARESEPGKVTELTYRQLTWLERLAEMTDF